MNERDEQINAAITLLRDAGYSVQLQERKVTSGELARDYGFGSTQMHALLTHPLCPHFECGRSATGRLLWLRANPALRAFLASKTPRAAAA
jgi:hypothetical protein